MSAVALSSTAAAAPVPASGWLRGPAFDAVFVGGVLALALGLGALASGGTALFAWVLHADLWLLAYPHVASTFTRIAIDTEQRRAHRFLLFGLPVLVLAATAGATWAGGVLALNSIYYYAQSYHYAKQSYGIARAYARTGGHGAGRDLLDDAVVFGFPIWGVLHRAQQAHPSFYAAPLWSPPVPRLVVVAAGAFAIASLLAWALRWARASDGSRPPLGHALYVLSHVVVTVTSYVAIRDVTQGWLVINVWHNAQYLLFVWARNTSEQRAPASGRSLRAFLFRPENGVWYALALLAVASAFYFAIGRAAERLAWAAFPLVLVVHQAVNFHHYLVDAVVWRRRRA